MASDIISGLMLKRTKTGCFTCRKRRKKCDEVRPKCAACSRNGLRCSWPEPQWKNGLCNMKTAPNGGDKGGPQDTGDWRCSDANFNPYDGLGILTPGVSPALANISPASRRTALSPLLLQSYFENTSLLMVAKPAHLNAFLTIILPTAYFDDLMMDALLAMSGQHLCGINGSQPVMNQSTWYHYGVALRAVHVRIRETKNLPAAALLDLILVLLLLCHAEAFSGEQQGTMYHHLRACRQLLLRLLERPGEIVRTGTRWLLGLALESDCFLAVVANITPYGLLGSRTLPIDDAFLHSAKHLESYDTFGSFFACGYSICAEIPSIATLGRQRLLEDYIHPGNISNGSKTTYYRILKKITRWRVPNLSSQMLQWSRAYEATGEIWRHAMILYLKNSMCGSTIDNAALLDEIQDHVDMVLHFLARIGSLPYGTIMMWPGLITGSCMINSEQQQAMLQRMRLSRFPNLHLVQASNLLELLWADTDERAFGPYGLFMTMKKHNINLSIA